MENYKQMLDCANRNSLILSFLNPSVRCSFKPSDGKGDSPRLQLCFPLSVRRDHLEPNECTPHYRGFLGAFLVCGVSKTVRSLEKNKGGSYELHLDS